VGHRSSALPLLQVATLSTIVIDCRSIQLSPGCGALGARVGLPLRLSRALLSVLPHLFPPRSNVPCSCGSS
jgi:hypothetical protein